jgi:hypothetical protein
MRRRIECEIGEGGRKGFFSRSFAQVCVFLILESFGKSLQFFLSLPRRTSD